MSKKNVKISHEKYEVKDWEYIRRAIALVISRLPDEPANLRYLRHLSRLQVTLETKGNGTHTFTEKQISSMTFALEMWKKDLNGPLFLEKRKKEITDSLRSAAKKGKS